MTRRRPIDVNARCVVCGDEFRQQRAVGGRVHKICSGACELSAKAASDASWYARTRVRREVLRMCGLPVECASSERRFTTALGLDTYRRRGYNPKHDP